MSELNNNPLNENELEQATGGRAMRYIQYIVVQGDTLWNLAKRFNTTVNEIKRLNPIIKDVRLIRVGWILTIPDNR